MTMLVGINFGGYILIAEDKAATGIYGLKVSESENKIKHFKIATITGTGSVSILDYIKNNLENENLTTPLDIFNSIKKSKKNLYECYPSNKKDIFSTGLLFSYEGENGRKLYLHYPRYFKTENNTELECEEGFSEIKENEYIVTTPSDFKESTLIKINKIIENQIKSKRNKDLEKEMLSKIFNLMANDSEQVTEEYDYIFL
jgi:hypothetical protein